MEREIQRSAELTGSSKNTYSNDIADIMPENGEGAPKPPASEVPKTPHEKAPWDSTNKVPDSWKEDLDKLAQESFVEVKNAADQVREELKREGEKPGDGGGGSEKPPAPPAGGGDGGNGGEKPPDRPSPPVGPDPQKPDKNPVKRAIPRKRGRIGTANTGQTAESTQARTQPRPIDRRSVGEVRANLVTEFNDPKFIKPEDFKNEELKKLAVKAKSLLSDSTRKNDPELIDELLEDFDEVVVDDSSRKEAEGLFKQLNILGQLRKVDREVSTDETRETFRLTLTASDFEDIDQDPLDWMERQIDNVYTYSKQGRELSSPQVSEAQQIVARAARYMILSKWGKEDPKLVEKFSSRFQTRLDLMFLRATLERRNIEQAKGLSQNIGVHGIMSQLTFENGLVNQMHNRMNELYDQMRMEAPHHHITPELHSQLQDRLEKEYLGLLEKGIELVKPAGSDRMSEVRRKRVIQATIRRAVRGAYDHFKDSQREAVVVARGDALPLEHDLAGIIADPSGVFMVYNYEQLLVKKFGLLHDREQELLDELKIQYAESELALKSKDVGGWISDRIRINPNIQFECDENGEIKIHEGGAVHQLSKAEIKKNELVKYGENLMKDMMLVNDFYSSPWRLERFMVQINDTIKYQYAKSLFESEHPAEERESMSREQISEGIKARFSSLAPKQLEEIKAKSEDFGLFMRLRVAHKGLKLPNGEEPTSEHREAVKKEIWAKIATYRPEDIVRIFREKGSQKEIVVVNSAFEKMGLSLTDEEKSKGLTLYDKFKDEYGAALRLAREAGFSQDMPEQIDFSEILTNPKYSKYLEVFNKALGSQDSTEATKVASLFKELKEFAGNRETISKLLNDSRFEDIYSRAYSIDDALLDRLEELEDAAVASGITPLSAKLTPESGADGYARSFSDAEAATEAHTQYLTFLMTDSPEEKHKAAIAAAKATKRYSGTNDGARVFRYTYISYTLLAEVPFIADVFDIRSLPFRQAINKLQKIEGPQALSLTSEQMIKILDDNKSYLIGSGKTKKEAERLWLEARRLGRTDAKSQAQQKAIQILLFAMLYMLFEGAYIGKEAAKNDEVLKAA